MPIIQTFPSDGGNKKGKGAIKAYYNSTDGKFYKESTYATEITPDADSLYLDLSTENLYDCNGSVYTKINPISSSTITTALGYTPYNSANVGTAAAKNYTSSVTQSSTDLVTSGAVWSAIDNLPEPMVFKGTLGTGGTITDLPAAAAANHGDTYKVITAGTYTSIVAKVGDVFTSDGSSWVLIPAGDTDSDTWRTIKVNGTEKLGSAISTGAVDFVNGTNTTVSFDATGNKISVSATDEKITALDGNPSINQQYYPLFVPNNQNQNPLYNDGFMYTTVQGTSSSLGYSILSLGNSRSSGRDGNKYGQIYLYSKGHLSVRLFLDDVNVSDFGSYDIKIPTYKSGTIALTSDITITGIKGDAESAYRTGNVNLTPANIGALASNGTAAKATADSDGNTINTTYMKKGVDYVTAGQKSGTTLGANSTAEGINNTASGDYSHAEGYNTTAKGNYSHAEGENTIANRKDSHAEGVSTTADGNSSHSEGYKTNAFGAAAHAEGDKTKALDTADHAEGSSTTAYGGYSHAEGYGTKVSGKYSHTEGLETIAKGQCQHVEGQYNVEDTNNTYAHIIGGGTSSARKNIFTVDWNGDVCAGRSNGLTNDLKLPTGADVVSYLNSNLLYNVLDEPIITSGTSATKTYTFPEQGLYLILIRANASASHVGPTIEITDSSNVRAINSGAIGGSVSLHKLVSATKNSTFTVKATNITSGGPYNDYSRVTVILLKKG